MNPKRRLFCGLLCLCMLVSMLPLSASAYTVTANQEQGVLEKVENRIPICIAHKSDWRNYPENTLLSIQSSIEMGVDMVELDVHVTSDGVPVLLHDENLRRMTSATDTTAIGSLTWAQVKKYTVETGSGNTGVNYTLTSADAAVLNSVAGYSTYVGTAKSGGTMPIARFDLAMELIDQRCMAVLDKMTTSARFAACYQVAREKNMLDYVLFKNNLTAAEMEPWYAEAADRWNSAHPNEKITAVDVRTSFIYECTTTNLTTLQAHLDAGVRLVSISTGVTDANKDRIVNTVAPWCVKNGVMLRANAGEGLGDTAKIDSPIGWAELLEVGVTAILTDQPAELIRYLQTVYHPRLASEPIEAEHFTSCNYSNVGFTIPLEQNASYNNYVNGMVSGDYMVYKDIYFDGTERTLSAYAKGSGGSLKFYLDGTAESNRIGTLTFTGGSYSAQQVQISAVTAGYHRLHVVSTGAISVDVFHFSNHLLFGFDGAYESVARYRQTAYGVKNYDAVGNWLARTATMSNLAVDTATGTLSATLTGSGNHYLQTGSDVNARLLHYLPQAGDSFQIRLRIDDAVANTGGEAMQVGLVFAGDGCGNFDYNERVMADVPASAINGGYITLIKEMNSAFTSAKEITSLRIYLKNFASASGKTAKFTVDYLYIGPRSAMPKNDSLYFDFTDTAANRQRYGDQNYGRVNYDDDSGWIGTYVSKTVSDRVRIDRNDYTLTLTRHEDNSNAYMYLQTWSDNASRRRKLNFDPSKAEILQVRMKLEGFSAASATSRICLNYYANGNDTQLTDAAVAYFGQGFVFDGDYMTITAPIKDSFRTAGTVNSIRVLLRDLSGMGSVTFDYIYIGPKASAPTREAFEKEGIAVAHTLNLASDIAVSYAVRADVLSKYETYRIECLVPVYEGNTLVETRKFVLTPENKGDYVYFTLTGMTAVSMADEIEARLYLSKNGENYFTPVDRYSIAQYAYTILGMATAPESLKQLCADLLRYGAAAQTFKNHHTDNMADQAMSETDRSYLSDLDAVTFGHNNAQGTELANPSVTWVGKTLNLGSKVALKYVFNTSAYEGDLAELSLHLSYVNGAGENKTAVVTNPEPYNAEKKQYAFSFDGLLAAELRSVVTAAVYQGDKQVSNSLIYSADTYGNGTSGTLLSLCKALFAYSDSALRYFNAN